MTFVRRIAVTCGAVAVLALAGVLPASAGAATPGVVPPQASPHGTSYGDWSARWWTWVFQTAATGPEGQVHPFLADVGTAQEPAPIDCSYAQTGKVWFLTGTYEASDANTNDYFANRSCTVPTGTALLMPVINSEWDNTGVPLPERKTLAELYRRAADDIDAVTHMAATVDGRPVTGLTGPGTSYRVQSRPFRYTLPEGNLFGLPAGTATPDPGAVADGVFLFVHPLSVGEHVLHWEATVEVGGEVVFAQDITYHLTVAPRR